MSHQHRFELCGSCIVSTDSATIAVFLQLVPQCLDPREFV